MLYKLLLLILSMVFGMVLIETGIRVVEHIRPQETLKTHTDASGLPMLNPEQEGNYYSSEPKGWLHIRTNNEGFVGKSYAPNASNNTKRIAIIGDSFVAALQVDWNKNLVSALENTLNTEPLRERAAYEVLNFGITGLGTVQEMALYQAYVKKYHPDLVLLVFYVGNDFQDNSRFVGQKDNILNGIIDLAVDAAGDSARMPAQKKPSFVKNIIWESRLYQLLRNILLNNESVAKLLVRLHIARNRSVITPLVEPTLANMMLYTDQRNETSRNIMSFTVDILKKFAADMRADGSKFAVVLLPSYWQVDNAYHKRFIDFAPNADTHLPQTALKNGLESIPLLDLADAYDKAINEQHIPMFFGGRGHLTEQGSDFTAKEIYRFLRERSTQLAL